MNTISFSEVVKLSDRELLSRVQILADREREMTAALIAHLAVLDERRLYLGEGCSSLFIARLRPWPLVPSMIRQLPTRTASLVFTPLPDAAADAPPASPPASPALVIHPPARPVVIPLTPNRYKIQFTASEETHELLRRAQDLLRHQIPNGDVGEVIAKALKVLNKELEKEKIAATGRPRGSRGSDPRSRHIPAEVRRKVWERDGGTCAFVAHNGRRCTERAFLEFHHVVPYAADGRATVENIQLRCRAHNAYEAELHFGSTGSGPT